MILETSHTERLVGTLLERLGGGDADAIAALFARDIDWYVGGNPALPWTGRRSHDVDVARYFRTMWPHFVSGKSSSTLLKLITLDDDAVVFATFTHTAAVTGRSFTTPVAMRVTIADGKITSLQLYEDTWLVNDAFLPPATLTADARVMEDAGTTGAVTTQSRFSFAETVRELSRHIVDSGGIVFATIDQQAAALAAGLSLRPTTVILFGNPLGGTPLMDARPLAGLDLPLKLLVWEESQVVRVAYASVREFGERNAEVEVDARIAAMGRLLKRVVESISISAR